MNNYTGKPIFPNNIDNDTTPNNVSNKSISYSDNSIYPTYLTNILRLNKKRKVNIYTSFPKMSDNKKDCFSGILEQVGHDHIVISDPNDGKWSVIPNIYIDYVSYDEPINCNNS